MTDTKCVGAVIMNGQEYMILVSPFTDGTAAELTIRDMSGTLKNMADMFPTLTLQGFWLTVGTPSDLDLVQLLDADGGIVQEWTGCINAALGHVPQLVVEGISIQIKKGYTFMGTTSD